MSQNPSSLYGVLIRAGTIYDGRGAPGRRGDVAIRGTRLPRVGPSKVVATVEVDATGLAVAPGFINMLSWATESLIAVDGKSASGERISERRENLVGGFSDRKTASVDGKDSRGCSPKLTTPRSQLLPRCTRYAIKYHSDRGSIPGLRTYVRGLGSLNTPEPSLRFDPEVHQERAAQ